MIEPMTESERDRHRLPRAVGPGFVMVAPECAAVGCTNGASLFGLCGPCHLAPFSCSMIKPRWLQTEPERWRSLEALLNRR